MAGIKWWRHAAGAERAGPVQAGPRGAAANQGYPYFVQLLGEALWRRVVAGGPPAGRRITRTDVEAVRADFEQKKGRYYLQRYSELQDQGLLPAARAVAEAFENRERLDGAQLEAAVRRGLGGRGRAADGGDREDPGSPGLHLAARRRAHLGTRHSEPHGLRADTSADRRTAVMPPRRPACFSRAYRLTTVPHTLK